LNKSELIQKISNKLDIPVELADKSVNLLIEVMSSSISNNQRIEIRGFGNFTLHYKAPRKAHNPKTGEKLITKPKYAPHFKPGKDLKDRVDASKSHVEINAFNDDL
jgi:integration host factor subunit beta